MNVFWHEYIGMPTMLLGCLVIGALLVVGVVLFKYSPTILYYVHMGSSKSLPYPSDHFTGRDDAMNDVVKLLDSKTSHTRIVNIIGSPGFGKSTLAVHIGHRLLKRGYIIHYVNLDEFPRKKIKQILAERVLDSSDVHDKAITFDRLLRWARERNFYTLIILDNCDESLHYQKEDVQDAIEKVIKNSHYVKFLMTSREAMMHVSNFEQYKLDTLSTEAACDLLQYKAPTSITLTTPEKKEIAELTGKVPLALQIIGSLLRLPGPASTRIIISELKKQPISILSPEQLPKNQQINDSFSLSYKYLSDSEKMVGMLLANFPGSFDQEAYEAVIGYNLTWANSGSTADIRNIITKLVQRSLLEYYGHNERYQFHCLIREYFLEKYRGTVSVSRFRANFQKYYFSLLNVASKNFLTNSYVKSLDILDTERHNFLLLMEDIKNFNIEINFTTVSTAIISAYGRGLLACRFSSDELLLIIQNTHTYLDMLINASKAGDIPTKWKGDYLYFVLELVQLHKDNHSTENALVLYEQYEMRVESFKLISSPQSKYYVLIQALVSELCSSLGYHNRSIQYYSRVIEFSQQALENCSSANTCSYRDLAKYCEIVHNFKSAAYFYNLSLTVDDLDLFTRLKTLHDLSVIYNHMGQDDDAEKTIQSVLSLLPAISNSPIHELYQHVGNIYKLASHVRENKHANEADMLEGYIIQVILNVSADNYYYKELLYSPRTPSIVELLYQKGSYTEAIKLGTSAVNLYKTSPEHNKYENQSAKLLYIIGRSKFHSGNYSDGLNDLECVLNFTNITYEYWTTCFYLAPRFEYLYLCFGSPVVSMVHLIMTTISSRIVSTGHLIITKISSGTSFFTEFALGVAYIVIIAIVAILIIIVLILYLTFISPLNCVQSNTHDIEQEMSFFPEITNVVLSSRKEIEVVSEGFLAKRLIETFHHSFVQQSIHNLYQHALFYYESLKLFTYKYPQVCLLFNMFSILIRIYITLFLLTICCLGILALLKKISAKLKFFYSWIYLFSAKIYFIFLLNRYLNKFMFIFLSFMCTSELFLRYIYFYCRTLPAWFLYIHIIYFLYPKYNLEYLFIFPGNYCGFSFLINALIFIFSLFLLLLVWT